MPSATVPRDTNRRLTARVVCQLTVLYRAGRDWHPATAMDLSRAGCRVRLGEDLERGTSVTVRVDHPGKEGAPGLSAEVAGTVIWSRFEGLSHQAGVHFDGDSPALLEILSSLG
jgi:hypothetical protein